MYVILFTHHSQSFNHLVVAGKKGMTRTRQTVKVNAIMTEMWKRASMPVRKLQHAPGAKKGQPSTLNRAEQVKGEGI